MVLVKSFLAMPRSGKTKELSQYLRSYKSCEVTIPTSGEQAIVVVMENENEAAENELLEKIHQSTHLEHMVLISSFNPEYALEDLLRTEIAAKSGTSVNFDSHHDGDHVCESKLPWST